ncbi:MAG: hypothetical protein HQ592_00695 [Planctomycetes bacterium]|nr:hypothetical protein [Planctomycetota bacterium]
MGPFLSSYKVAYECHYRYGDVPEDKRQFSAWQRTSPDVPWERRSGQIEMDDLLLRAISKHERYACNLALNKRGGKHHESTGHYH